MADVVISAFVWLLLCRKAQRVAEDMRQLTIKMKAMQGQLEKVAVYAESIL